LASYVKEQKAKYPKKSEQSIRNKFYAKDNMRDELEREILNFLKNYHENFEEKLVLWDGFCRVCSNKKDKGCTHISGKSCRYPDKKRYSMEAVGIHVTQTVKNLNLGIEWPPINYYYRFGLVSFK
jgi:predicted metal-binding protein